MSGQQQAVARALDTLSFPLTGSQLIEASAGTGKTYTIASLYVRLVLGHGAEPGRRTLTPPDILVVTFTRAATQELRDRIRRRLNEAAACFLQEAEGDDFLRSLRDDYPVAEWPGRARVLQIAAEWMDDAAVSTIDAWCYRMLREHAFDSASLFDVEMDVNAAESVAEATRDYWRLHIAPLAPEGFEAVLRAIGSQKGGYRAVSDCDTFAGILHRGWLGHAGLYRETAAPEQILAQLRERRAACKADWQGWVPQMRACLQAAYDDNLFHRAKFRANHWQGWLDALQDWAADPQAEAPFDGGGTAWTRLTPEGLAEVWKEGDPPQHPGFKAMAGLRAELAAQDADLLRIFPHAADWVARRVADLRRQRAMLDFNGLLEQLDAALRGPNGARLAQVIRRQFPAALIDEFQDTNPVQYQIFDSIYNVDLNGSDSLLALIGDPKQAIYRFRGADIHAYLAARRACAGRIHTLGSNYRSSSAMVGAVNHLFMTAERRREHGAFLFRRQDGKEDNPIPFQPVAAAKNPGEWLVDGKPGAALTVWCDTTYDRRGSCGIAVAQSCASEILRLLQLAAAGRAGFSRDGGFAPLQARDIAILVNNRNEAAELRGELSRRGIRSVYLSDDSSVYHSGAAADVLAWLRACAEPENGGHVRAALATAALGFDWGQLDAFAHDDVLWESMLERFAGYKEQWRRRGLLPMLRRFMHEFGVPARLFAGQAAASHEGERQLTDLLHLAELLQAASVRLDGEHALIRYLEARIETGGEADADGDASRVRLESDAGLVQVVTVHKSKGLEYPLVFYPYAYHSRAVTSLELPAFYRDGEGQPRVLANPGDAEAANTQDVLMALERERLAEDLRKLYVALTRARHATWMALAPVIGALDASAMGYLLGGSPACAADQLEASLEDLAEGCDSMAVTAFPAVLEGRYQAAGEAQPPAGWRVMRRRIEQRWTMSSYSGLTRLAMERSESAAALRADAAVLALPDAPGVDTYFESYQSETGVSRDEANALAAVPAGIHAFPRGAAPGSFLHMLLEWVFRQGPRRMLADPAALRAGVEQRCRSRGWQAHVDAVCDWLEDFFTRAFHLAPRGCGPQPDLVLADLAPALPEMEFWFGVRDLDLPALDALVARHFQPGRARALITRGRLNGLLRGFIDLVFEHDGRYYVADYKSNWLGPADQAYDGAAVARAVLEHRYDLQSALYLFALHRLLESRLGDAYDYDAHLGGALVFFVRGAASGMGLHVERPAREALDGLARLFEGGENGAGT